MRFKMDNAHREFVDKMHPAFGLAQHPGYCTIEVKPLIVSGGFILPDKILINDLNAPDSVAHIVFHESAHFLHPYCRTFWQNFLQTGKRGPESLNEVVAHLGTIIFLSRHRGSDEVEKYINDRRGQPVLLIAQDLFPQTNLLEKLANADFKEAKRIIAPYTLRRLSL